MDDPRDDQPAQPSVDGTTEGAVVTDFQGERGFWTRTGMPRWVPRLVLLVIAAFLVTYVAFHAVGKLSYFLHIIVYSLFVSLALEPAVNWLEDHGWKRGLATLAMMFVAVIAGLLVIASMVPLIIGETEKLVTRIPDWVNRLDPYLLRYFHVTISISSAASAASFLKDHLAGYAGNIATRLLGLAKTAVSLIFQLLTVAMFSYYLVADAPRLRRGVCSLFEPDLQRAILRGWEISIQKMGGYLYSKGFLALIIGLSTFAVLKILDMPYALALALWLAFFAEFIPNIGTYIGAVVPLVVAGVEKGLVAFIVLLVFILVYQQLENYFLSPRISAHTMELHPAVAFGAAIVGASLYGAIGAFLALPAVAIIQSFVSTYLHRYEVIDSEMLHEHGDDEPPKAPRRGRRLRWPLGDRDKDDDRTRRIMDRQASDPTADPVTEPSPRDEGNTTPL